MTHPTYRRPIDVAAVDGESNDSAVPRLYLAHLPDGPVVVLDGPAAVIWREAIESNDKALTERVAASFDVAAEDVGGDIDHFVADLLSQNLLERIP